jgi:hypothetical protein
MPDGEHFPGKVYRYTNNAMRDAQLRFVEQSHLIGVDDADTIRYGLDFIRRQYVEPSEVVPVEDFRARAEKELDDFLKEGVL